MVGIYFSPGIIFLYTDPVQYIGTVDTDTTADSQLFGPCKMHRTFGMTMDKTTGLDYLTKLEATYV